ncbi:MAG: cysteine--tRNA ligase, partial [Chitinivibrionales bacterium]|nr:cysteine--tRNA ligase [Chitinivibrionales bacterium]
MKPKSEISFYNTASRSKESFSAASDMVGMYACGPTVYNSAHIGNLRTYIFEDVLKRALVAAGYGVNHVMNITDVGHLTSDEDTGEDKMEKGAAREGKTVWEIADFYTGEFKQSLRDLNILGPTRWVKATDHIPEMIAMIAALEEKGFTYTTADGVYFDTGKFPRYCDFARIDAASLAAGSRIDMGEKRAVTDFALWKFSPKDVRRQMEWPSPWGVGFPGWHIECSAMALKYLPQPLDIHCGGSDHVRVHHTNEIAQAEAATGRQFVRFWLHGEFLVLDKGKMAKSGGNFVTLKSVAERGIAPLAYRLFCFSAHYRSPLTFSFEALEASAAALKNLKSQIAAETAVPAEVSEPVAQICAPFYAAVNDDMNMSVALAALWDIVRSKVWSKAEKYCAVKNADEILGLNLLVPEERGAEIKTTAPSGFTVIIKSAQPITDTRQSEIVAKVEAR